MTLNLTVDLPGLQIRNPLIAASGLLGASSSLMVKAYRSGAGAVVTKSMGLDLREGFPGPNVVVLPYGLLNSMGLPNPGVEEMVKEIKLACDSGVKLIASIYGFNVDDYSTVASEIAKTNVVAVELNFSCPTVEGTGQEIGQDPIMVKKIVNKIKSTISKPVFVKLTPNITDIVIIGKAAEEAGADAVVAINTVGGMSIDINFKRPILSVGVGGISGPAIKPIAIKSVYRLYESLNIPIIGCGGIVNFKDVVEFFLAGASAVQVGTALMYRDFEVFKELKEDLVNYMFDNGYSDISQLTGLGHT